MKWLRRKKNQKSEFELKTNTRARTHQFSWRVVLKLRPCRIIANYTYTRTHSNNSKQQPIYIWWSMWVVSLLLRRRRFVSSNAIKSSLLKIILKFIEFQLICKCFILYLFQRYLLKIDSHAMCVVDAI